MDFLNDGSVDIDYLLRSVGLAMRAVMDKELRVFDLSPPQGRLLGAIYFGTHNGGIVNRKDLQLMMRLSGPSVTSLLDGLEEKGLVNRKVASEDGRLINLTVTDKGKEIVQDIMRIFSDLRERLTRDFTLEEVEAIRTFLSRMEKNLQG